VVEFLALVDSLTLSSRLHDGSSAPRETREGAVLADVADRVSGLSPRTSSVGVTDFVVVIVVVLGKRREGEEKKSSDCCLGKQHVGAVVG